MESSSSKAPEFCISLKSIIISLKAMKSVKVKSISKTSPSKSARLSSNSKWNLTVLTLHETWFLGRGSTCYKCLHVKTRNPFFQFIFNKVFNSLCISLEDFGVDQLVLLRGLVKFVAIGSKQLLLQILKLLVNHDVLNATNYLVKCIIFLVFSQDHFLAFFFLCIEYILFYMGEKVIELHFYLTLIRTILLGGIQHHFEKQKTDLNSSTCSKQAFLSWYLIQIRFHQSLINIFGARWLSCFYFLSWYKHLFEMTILYI